MKETVPYTSVIRDHPKKSLKKLITDHLDQCQQEALLLDILEHTHLEKIRPWLEMQLEVWQTYTPHLEKVAFDFLLTLDKGFLSQHSDFLERLYKEHWDKKDKIIIKLNSLTAVCKGGIRINFLENLVSQTHNEIEEASLRLLIIKLEEDKEDFVVDKYSKQLNISEKPYLFVTHLYLYRISNPLKGIQSMFALDGKVLEKEVKQPSTEVLNLGKGYLRQCIFNFLKDGEEKDYWTFLDHLNRFLPWIRDYIKNVLNHPSLEKIKEKIDRYNSNLTDTEHQKKEIIKIEYHWSIDD